jgi:DNA-binding beta-propeller fold protein YncE
VFDPITNSFFVNVLEPPVIVAIDVRQPAQIAQTIAVPVAGPHGLDVDVVGQRLFCACDGGRLVTVDTRTGAVRDQGKISGVPDVVFFNAARQHLYVAVADPGVIDVFDTRTMQRIATVPSERGAKTLAFDAARDKVYAFLSHTQRAAVYWDGND